MAEEEVPSSKSDHGGGGERVLWIWIAALLRDIAVQRNVHLAIYSASPLSKEQIIENVMTKFGLSLTNTHHLSLIPLHTPSLLHPSHYPFLTILCQALASVVVCLESVWTSAYAYHAPDIFIDTMGVAWGYGVVRGLGGCEVVAYVHYPTISEDMVKRVSNHTALYNNSSTITSSRQLTRAKLLYYHMLKYAYGHVGGYVHLAMCNSSWTKQHMLKLWAKQQRDRIVLVYPPCNTKDLLTLPCQRPLYASPPEDWLSGSGLKGRRVVVSLGQFRPEKDHMLQIKVMHSLVQNPGYADVILVMMGSTRNEADESLAKGLEQEIQQLGIGKHVVIARNPSYAEVKRYLSVATAGIHTMVQEHFGISVVEMMAAGLVTLAHDSAGPRMDIIHKETKANGSDGEYVHVNSEEAENKSESSEKDGYLASNLEDYVASLQDILEDTPAGEARRQRIRESARVSVRRFDDQVFEREVVRLMEKMM
eukprot:gene24635-29768_t